jgi:hypothetical protein
MLQFTRELGSDRQWFLRLHRKRVECEGLAKLMMV